MASAFLKRKTWYVNFKDGVGRRRTIATRPGRKPKTEMRQIAADLEHKASRQRLGLKQHPSDCMDALGRRQRSGRLDVDLQLNAGCVELRLHRELDENCLGVTENSCPPCRALGAYATAPLLDVAEVGARDAEALCEILQRVLVGLTDGSQQGVEGERSAAELLQILHRGALLLLDHLLLLSTRAC